MSVKLMSMVYDVPVSYISAPAKSILLAMADNAWDNGTSCYPSRGLLEHKTNLSSSTIQRGLAELKFCGLIEPVGKTNMNVVEWRLVVDSIVSVMVPYRSERPYPIVTETITPSQSDQETISEPSVEPTYVSNDADGVPAEHLMVYQDILAYWQKKFKFKTQPRSANVKLQRKVKARLKDPTFQKGIMDAIEVATANPGLIKDTWFQLEYLLRNDENWNKVLNREFDWKIRGDAPGSRVADPIVPVKPNSVTRDNWNAPSGGGV